MICQSKAEDRSVLSSALFFHRDGEQIKEGGGELIIYIISLRTPLTALFVFCQITTKTVTADLLMCV